MIFLLPRIEQRSHEDIELHYADDLKEITDIRILINRKRVFELKKYHLKAAKIRNLALKSFVCLLIFF